ncbi:MAG TPA: SUMF1/EgtB/PvdO family nonheme iron enzyme [Kofleriaceae bacterium]|nr:SUMF1/EgtB/PvdO family nonheme iron enzyme [Kofleriaceae bacterium]
MVARARIDELRAARAASDAVFSRLSPDAMRTRAVRERHRFVFYLGHLEAFDANLLRHELEIASPRDAWDARFARGIDPIGRDGLPTDDADDWPPTDEVRAYGRGLRDAIDRALIVAKHETLVEAMIEHRLMHVETLAYLAHQLPIGMVARDPSPSPPVAATPPPTLHKIEIPAGRVTLGAPRDGRFAWDNERDAIEVDVGAFAIDAYPTTNRDWLAFVDAGGYADRALWSDDDWTWRTTDDIQAPRAWRRRDGGWRLRAFTSEIELPLDAPVYVSHAEASAYARWRRARLPTEAEWQRAAYGSSSGQRTYPWGDAAPDATRGNFDLVRDDATSVTAHPAGASAWGVHDLAGNGWEWTSSKFDAFPGFAPQPFYPGYSADFFDGEHYVMKGGSPRTAARLLRSSFRNWFQPHYPHVYATLRLVES